MLGQLYSPKGLALETAKAVLEVEYPMAVNVALGCTNACSYCYGPLASRQGKEKYGKLRRPKFNLDWIIEQQIIHSRTISEVEGVFMSFLTDPFLPELKKVTEELIDYLQSGDIPLDHDVPTATLSKIGVSKYPFNRNGLTIVSPYDEFSATFEPNVPSPKERIKLLHQAAQNRQYTWVSMEPFPVQDIYPYKVRDIQLFWDHLAAISVDFIIFGKWNYDPRAKTEKARQEYAEIVPLFIDFCKSYGIRYHIKSDTLKFISTQSKELRRE